MSATDLIRDSAEAKEVFAFVTSCGKRCAQKPSWNQHRMYTNRSIRSKHLSDTNLSGVR